MDIPDNVPEFRWRRQDGRYVGAGQECIMGRIVVGRVDHAIVARGDPLVYRATILLPGVRLKKPDHYATIDEAMDRVERAVVAWFHWIKQRPDTGGAA